MNRVCKEILYPSRNEFSASVDDYVRWTIAAKMFTTQISHVRDAMLSIIDTNY